MILKTSSNNRQSGAFHHAFYYTFQQGLGVSFAFFIGLLVLLPGTAAGIPGRSIFNINYTHNQMKYCFFSQDFTSVIQAAVILFGVFLSVSLFRFMLFKPSSDAMFSLCLTRHKLIFVRALAGGLLLAAVILIPLCVSLVLNFIAFGTMHYTDTMLHAAPFLFLGLFSLGLFAFCTTALVCCMVGTIQEAAVFSILLLFTPSALWYSFGTLSHQLLFGSTFGGQGGIGLIASWNPVTFFHRQASDYAAQYLRFDGYILPKPDWVLLAAWLTASLAVLLLADVALHKRKTEIADCSGQSRFLNLIITFSVSFLAFAAVLPFGSNAGKVFSLFVSFAAFLIVYFLSQKLQRGSDLSSLRQLAVQLGTVTFITAVLLTGGFGYSTRIPNAQGVLSAKITYTGSPNYFSGEVTGTSTGKGYYLQNSYTFSEPNEIKLVQSLHRSLLMAGKGKLALNSHQFSKTTVRYNIHVVYTLKNGHTVSRYYDRTTLEVLAELLKVDQTSQVKTAQSAAIVAGSANLSGASLAYQNGQVYLSDNWYLNPVQINFSSQQKNELLSCIAGDVEKQSLSDRYFPTKPPLGVIMFTQSGGAESLNFSYRLENALVYVTEEFNQTIAFLKKYNLYKQFNFTGQIEGITLQKYNPYVGINIAADPKSQYFLGYSSNAANDFIQTKDFGKDLTVNNPQQIKEISGLLQNTYFMSGGGYLASVKLKNSDRYVYKFLPQNLVPSYLTTAGM